MSKGRQIINCDQLSDMAAVAESRFSYYYKTLNTKDQDRYREKLAMLGGMADSYVTIADGGRSANYSRIEWQDWPDVDYPDIYNFFISSLSPCTHEELKAYKSMEGYKYMIDGWVNDIVVFDIPCSSKAAYLVTGKS